MIYILDEPSIGLHQRDNKKLLATLCRMRDIGNTWWSSSTTRRRSSQADHVIDFGPGAGMAGGRDRARRHAGESEARQEVDHGRYLSGRKKIPGTRASVARRSG